LELVGLSILVYGCSVIEARFTEYSYPYPLPNCVADVFDDAYCDPSKFGDAHNFKIAHYYNYWNTIGHLYHYPLEDSLSYSEDQYSIKYKLAHCNIHH
jgi:hypothetical protein